MLDGADCILCSPPYAETETAFPVGKGEQRVELKRQALRLAGYSEEYIRGVFTPGRLAHSNYGQKEHYGATPGQLGAMQAGTPPERGTMSTASAPVTTWDGCYDDGWKGLIVPEAFAHPAKFARGLIRRIYQYLLTSGRLAAGDRVVDPFGGVGLGGLDAMTSGLHWIGCELEPRFAALGEQNLALWRRLLDGDRRPGPRGSARLLCGDSRRLVELVGPALAEGVVSSPPFQGSDQRGSMESKAALHEACARDGRGHGGKLGPSCGQSYGDTAGNLGNDDGVTFWSAFRTILGQCAAILKPAGVLVLVCKDFVRDRARVPFSADTIKLAEACGFRLVEWIRASLVKSTAEASLFGGVIVETTERKSFFRRLAERKGSPRIDHEDILVFTKGPA